MRLNLRSGSFWFDLALALRPSGRVSGRIGARFGGAVQVLPPGNPGPLILKGRATGSLSGVCMGASDRSVPGAGPHGTRIARRQGVRSHATAWGHEGRLSW